MHHVETRNTHYLADNSDENKNRKRHKKVWHKTLT